MFPYYSGSLHGTLPRQPKNRTPRNHHGHPHPPARCRRTTPSARTGLGGFSIGSPGEVFAPGPLGKLSESATTTPSSPIAGLPRDRRRTSASWRRKAGRRDSGKRVRGDRDGSRAARRRAHSQGSEPVRIASGRAAVASVTALDIRRQPQALNGGALDRNPHPCACAQHTRRKLAGECYRWWRGSENLPHVLDHIEAVRPPATAFILDRQSARAESAPMESEITTE